MGKRKKVETYKDLEIWQKGMEIVRGTYKFTSALPDEEKYGLISQMRRAAISLPSNVAEGYRRRSDSELRQFLFISLSSAAELETQIEICRALYKPKAADCDELLSALDYFQAMTMNLIKKTEK
ncbi:four helix bundle protein [bacterium]|nr:MAG: four helix bundle protein [bacterium]